MGGDWLEGGPDDQDLAAAQRALANAIGTRVGRVFYTQNRLKRHARNTVGYNRCWIIDYRYMIYFAQADASLLLSLEGYACMVTQSLRVVSRALSFVALMASAIWLATDLTFEPLLTFIGSIIVGIGIVTDVIAERQGRPIDWILLGRRTSKIVRQILFAIILMILLYLAYTGISGAIWSIQTASVRQAILGKWTVERSNAVVEFHRNGSITAGNDITLEGGRYYVEDANHVRMWLNDLYTPKKGVLFEIRFFDDDMVWRSDILMRTLLFERYREN